MSGVISLLNLQAGRARSFGACPACGELKRSSGDHRFACGITKDGRGWSCHKCKAKGDGVDLISHSKYGKRSNDLGGPEWAALRAWCAETGLASPAAPGGESRASVKPMSGVIDNLMGRRKPRERSAPAESAPAESAPSGGTFGWSDELTTQCEDALWGPDGAGVLAYLESRGFVEGTIKEFRLGAKLVRSGELVVEQHLTIPLCDERGVPINMRFRAIPGDCLACMGTGCSRCGQSGEAKAKPKYRVCKGRPLPLFGCDRFSSDLKKAVIVTEGELDAIALHQYGYHSSVVSGTAGAGALTDEWLDLLEPFTHFVLAYDDDEAGHKGADAFAEKMGKDRCSRAIFVHPDAGSCLEANLPAASMRRCIEQAKPMFGIVIRRVNEYATELEQLVSNPESLRGRPFSSARLGECLGGQRAGLRIISGDTGQGKTTFATWLAWDEARLGTPVMLTSFEQKPIGTVQKLIRMQLGNDFTKVTKAERLEALDELGKSPIHVLHHYGHIPAEKLMQTIRYAVRRLGVRHIVVDHLGFLIPPDAEDERRAIEGIIRALALTAYSASVLITLICHPKNVRPGERVTMRDLKGASAIRQDADEVLIVEAMPPRPNATPPRPWPTSRVHIDKCRSEFGRPNSKCTLAFGPLSCVYADSWESTPEGNSGLLVVTP